MSALEKIRKHSGLVITVIGVALLVFVVQDLVNSDNKGRNRGRENVVAVVNGDKISYDEIRNWYSSRYGSANPTAEQLNSVLDMTIRERIMNSEYDATGVTVSPDELDDLFTGEKPHNMVTYFFQGNWSPENVKQYEDAIHGENVPKEYRNQWVELKYAVRKDRMEQKFNNLVKASYYVPTKLAEKYYNDKNEKTSAQIIAVRYDVTSPVEITDKDKKKYYEENKNLLFETDAIRDIEYVVFPIEPSKEDNENVRQQVADLKDQFAATDNIINFVTYNSDFGHRYDSTWMGRTDVVADIESAIFDGGQLGDIVGPYFDGNAYNLARIVEFQNRADSLKASHILIPYVGALRSSDTVTTKEMAQKRADSIANVLKKNPKDTKLFGKLAAQFSSDPGSAEKEGDLDWFPDGVMVYNFNEYVMKNAVGQIGVVETPFGYHVIKVTGKTEMQPKARLAVVRKSVDVSPKTDQYIHSRAHRFANENGTYEKFIAAAQAEGLNVHPAPKTSAYTFNISNLGNESRTIVRWAFDKKTKVGDVKLFTFPDMFVVAAVADGFDEGYAPIEKVAVEKENQILNMKRGEIYVSKMKACGNDYDRMIKELKADTATVRNLTMETRNIGNFGIEPSIVGTIIGMKEGDVAGPLAGGISAFIIKNVKHQAAPPTTDYSSILTQRRAWYTNFSREAVYPALRKNAKIKDDRLLFF